METEKVRGEMERGSEPGERRPWRKRRRPGLFRISIFVIQLAAFFLTPLSAQERDLSFNSEQLEIEAARHLFRIEGNPEAARRRLEALLAGSRNEEILSQARFLLGRILDKAGDARAAAGDYRAALGGRGLQGPEKLWVYRRLLELDPGSVQPAGLDQAAPSGPSHVYPGRRGKRTAYALEFRGPPDGQWERPKRIGLQDEDGNFHLADLRLGGRQEILDADPGRALVLDQDTRKAFVVGLEGKDAGMQRVEAPAGARVDFGALFADDPDAFLLAGAGSLRLFRRGRLAWEAPLDQDGCAWTPAPDRSERGVLQCADNQLFLVEARKKSLRPLPGITDKALQVAWQGDYLAVRYIDRFEIRKGPGFETVKWGMPGLLQEKLVLGDGRAFVVSPKGQIKAFDLATGTPQWQRDAQASQLAVFGDALFAVTYAQTIAAYDDRGTPQWTYEFGWDHEPTLLPNEDWLVLHYPDGKRIKLDRELLRVTGNAPGLKFLDYGAFEAQRDWKGALGALDRVLDLEPGNGGAWRLRAGALRNLGAPRPLQAQALVQAARSPSTASWSNGPVLKALAGSLGANWVWKRQYGPKFYPTLVPHKNLSFYLENDNQTLVVLDHETGELFNSFRFSEELDMKVALWKNDTVCVSSPSRIYLLSPASGSGGLGQIPIKNPVCQAQAVAGGVAFSDWYGGLSLLGLPDRTIRWERQLGHSGLYLGKSRNAEYLDVVDLEGDYFAVQPASGKVLWQAKLPSGTITETFSNKDFIYAGYSQGLLAAVDRNRQSLAWTVDFGEQIFSLSGNRDNTLILTTASKMLFCIQAQTGAILSKVRIQSYLFNRPTVIDHGYWLGTTEPALEKRGFNHELILKYKLPDLPGSPVLYGNSVFIGTLDNFILGYPSQASTSP